MFFQSFGIACVVTIENEMCDILIVHVTKVQEKNHENYSYWNLLNSLS